MIRTIEETKYRQLYTIAELAAFQLFFQDALMTLAQAIKDGKDGQEELKLIDQGFPAFKNNNNLLIKLLQEVKILKPIEEIEQPAVEQAEVSEIVGKKPTFTIVK